MKRPERLATKREEAIARSEEREIRGDAGQLARLIERGHGHCKEAKRLWHKIEGRKGK